MTKISAKKIGLDLPIQSQAILSYFNINVLAVCMNSDFKNHAVGSVSHSEIAHNIYQFKKCFLN